MLPAEAIAYLIRPMVASGVEFMVTGGVAAVVYGEPRLTNDVDIVAALAPNSAPQIVAAFPEPAYYAPPLEVIREEAGRTSGGHFNVLHRATSLRGDFYLAGSSAFAKWALAHRRTITVGPDLLPIAPPEYVIGMKLEYFRQGGSDRHLRDIRAMLRLNSEVVDPAVLAEWVERLGLGDVYRQLMDTPLESQ